MNVGETQAAAAAASNERAPDSRGRSAQRAVGQESRLRLFQALEARMQERTKNLQKFLDDRVEREVANVTAVMQELERSIREALTDKEDPQLQFDWTDVEKQQRERDIGSLRGRLVEMPAGTCSKRLSTCAAGIAIRSHGCFLLLSRSSCRPGPSLRFSREAAIERRSPPCGMVVPR